MSQTTTIKIKALLLPLLLSLIPAGIIVLNLVDLVNLLTGSSAFPLVTDYIEPYSLYSSKPHYILYNLAFTGLLVITIYSAFRKNWPLFAIAAFFDFFMLYYPLYTLS